MRTAIYQPSVEDLQEWFSSAEVAVEAMMHDVMEPDRQGMKIWTDLEGLDYTVSWKWRCYENRKTFKLDVNLATNVKAYMFDLIIMTRNL